MTASTKHVPVRDLLAHLELYYSDYGIARDLDAALSCAGGEEAAQVIRKYARLRRRADGFRPHDPTANNHGRIDPADLVALLDGAWTVTGHAVSCQMCGRDFTSRRTTARYCGDLCRKRANRGDVTLNRLSTPRLGDSSIGSRHATIGGVGRHATAMSTTSGPAPSIGGAA